MTAPMAGGTVLVTGASGGIGLATALGLARMGANVAIVGSNEGRILAAADTIHLAGGHGVHAFVADLSSQAGVRQLAREVLDQLPRLDVLINNVGGYWNSRHVTKDGLELTFALNHLAPFLLTNLLIDRLLESRAGRIVTVSSNAHRLGRIDFDDPQGVTSFSGARAYNQSKLANLLFAYELARRLGGTSVTSNALHPGMVSTRFGAADPGRLQRILVPLMRPVMKSPAQGARGSIHLASSHELSTVTGQFFNGTKAKQSSKNSRDEAVARRLWQVSHELVGMPNGGGYS